MSLTRFFLASRLMLKQGPCHILKVYGYRPGHKFLSPLEYVVFLIEPVREGVFAGYCPIATKDVS